MADETVKDSVWTREQDIAFENALVTYPDEDAEDRWEKIAAAVPGEKSAEEIKSHYELLLEDLDRIESGVVPLPLYGSSLDDSESHAGEGGTSKKGGQNMNESNHGGKASKADQERRKGIAWTEDEHRLFLLGLEKYGKGDWRSISRNFVVTRTPTQVASHAQKYFIRLNSMNKDRRRSSIHDITSVNNADVSVPQPPTNGSPAAASKSSKQPTGVNMYGGTTIGQPVVGTPLNLAAAPPHVAYGMGTPVAPGAPPNMDARPSRHR